MEIVILLITFVGFLWGGNMFVSGASAIGARLGMSPVLVGATIVAVGTSLPEWAVSVLASWQGSGGLAAGNVVGSNLCNLCIILGLAAVIFPLPCARDWLMKDGVIMLIATAAFFVVSFDGEINRLEGFVLLAMAVGTIVYLVRTNQDEVEMHLTYHWWHVPMALAGLAMVLVSCNFFVEAAQSLAVKLGVSQWLIGLTVAAIGTSLPELVTSLIAATQRRSGVLVGNVLGSNTMNLLFVLGSAAAVRPVHVDALGPLLAGSFVGLMVLPLIFLRTHYVLSRWEGAVLVAGGLGWYVLAARGG